jgi:hypothetical protein
MWEGRLHGKGQFAAGFPLTATREDDNRSIPGGDCIGWIEGNDIYLDPDAAFAAAQKLASEQGERLGITDEALRKRLHEGGLLAEVDATRRRLTVRRTIMGRSPKEVLSVAKRFSRYAARKLAKSGRASTGMDGKRLTKAKPEDRRVAGERVSLEHAEPASARCGTVEGCHVGIYSGRVARVCRQTQTQKQKSENLSSES